MHTRILACAAMLAAVQLASAAQVTFTDRTAFLSSVLNPSTFDFETASGFPAAPAPLGSLAGGTVSLTTVGGAAAVNIQDYGNGFGQAIGGRATGGGNANFSPVLLTFNDARFAVGFDDLDLTASGGVPSEFAHIQVFFADGTPTQSYIVSETDSDFRTAAFFGIVSTSRIASIQVFSTDTSDPGSGSRANLIDNVTIADPIPEHQSWLALLIGLALFTLHKAFAHGSRPFD